MTLAGFISKVWKRIEVSLRFIVGKIRAPFSRSCYEIKRGYIHRKEAVYFDDTSLRDEYQREVYELASFYADRYGYKNVLDIGCGSGYKLLQFFPDRDTTGIDVSPTYEFLKTRYPDRKWVNALEKDRYPTAADLIICSDVIEHFEDPDELMQTISKIQFSLLFLSTPERTLARGWYDYGPPDNTAHVREWTAKELRSYVSRYFEVIAHQVTNIEDATQLLICKKKAPAD